MPWIVPSHQAPAILLKKWRPGWFSGLGLALGTLAPDLEFIVPLRKGTVVSHTLFGQVIFTVPIAIVLYLLTCDLVWPWLLPNLPLRELPLVRRPKGREWLRVGGSALVGGLTHIALDGFTHPVADYGWAVALLPPLQWNVGFPFGAVPIYDVLQNVLSLALGIAALRMWHGAVREGRFWTLRGEASGSVPPSPSGPVVACWLVACGGLGALAALVVRGWNADALSFAAYGVLDGVALGMLVAAGASQLRRPPRAPFARPAALAGAPRNNVVTAFIYIPGQRVAAGPTR